MNGEGVGIEESVGYKREFVLPLAFPGGYFSIMGVFGGAAKTVLILGIACLRLEGLKFRKERKEEILIVGMRHELVSRAAE